MKGEHGDNIGSMEGRLLGTNNVMKSWGWRNMVNKCVKGGGGCWDGRNLLGCNCGVGCYGEIDVQDGNHVTRKGCDDGEWEVVCVEILNEDE